MAWARIDDNFFNHPKVRKAGKDAVMFHVAALCHSNAFTTDGFIANDMLELIATQAFQRRADGYAERLVECELWERVEGGYLIHDFLKYNHSKTEVEQIRSKKSIAGKQGGRPIKAEDKPEEKQNESKTKANNETKKKVIESHTQPMYLKQPPPLCAREELVGSIFKTYEREIGLLTPIIADDIKSAAEDYPLEWFEEAFKEAARNNKRSWKYALAILKRWKAEGFKVDTRAKQPAIRGNNGSRRHKPDLGDYVPDKSGVILVTEDD